MTVSQMLKIDGVQKTMAEKIYNNIRKGLTNIPLPKLAAATPFFGLNFGERRMQTLFDEFGDKMFTWTGFTKGGVITRISEVKGFSKKTARQFADGIKPFNAFLKKNSTLITLKKPEKKKSSKLAGKSFCFTGFRSRNLEDRLKVNAANVVNSVSKTLTALIAKNPEESSTKLNKARELKVKIYSPEQFEKYIKSLGV